MRHSSHFLTVLFGPIGDTLMALALFDDILSLEPNATLHILSRRNVRLIRDLSSSYPQIKVLEIPSGIASLPFFLRLLLQRWTLLTLGVSGVYSLRLKLFFFFLTHLPGNRTVGFNDRLPGEKKWLPLQEVIQFEEKYFIIDNFRRLLPFIFGIEGQQMHGRAPKVSLQTALPKDFPFLKGQYIATNLFSVSSHRSRPLWQWKQLLPKIAATYPHLPLIIMGGPDDAEQCEELAHVVPGAVAMPGLPLLEAAGVIENSSLYLGVDTGITHLAGVLQHKSLIFSHYSFPTWLPTYNPNARAIANGCRCECRKGGKCVIEDGGRQYRRCLYDISDEAALSAIDLALSSKNGSVKGFAGFIDENLTNH